MRISNWSSDVCSSDLDRNARARPRPETGFDPVEWPLRAIGRHRFAQDRRARLALLGGKLVEPLDVLIGQVGKDASHDILISYHDIMSNSPIVAVDKDHRELHRIGGADVRLLELRPAGGPDGPDRGRQFRRGVHMLRDDRVPIDGFTGALANLRLPSQPNNAGRL